MGWMLRDARILRILSIRARGGAGYAVAPEPFDS